MKTIKSFTALAIAAASMMLLASKASAQELALRITTEENDSLEFVNHASDSHPGGWNFDFVGLDVKYKHCHSNRSLPTLTFFSGWGFGVSGALNAPADVDINMGRSFNFCIEDIVAVRMHPWKTGAFSIGAGIDLKNYRMTGDKRFVENINDKQITVEDYDQGNIPNWSKIRTLSGTFNLKYIQYLGKGFRLAFGPEMYIVTKANKRHEIVTSYTNSDGDQKERFKGIKTNKVGLNLVGTLNYKNLFGVYAKYSPSSVLNPSFGPEFNSLSVGVMLFGL